MVADNIDELKLQFVIKSVKDKLENEIKNKAILKDSIIFSTIEEFTTGHGYIKTQINKYSIDELIDDLYSELEFSIELALCNIIQEYHNGDILYKEDIINILGYKNETTKSYDISVYESDTWTIPMEQFDTMDIDDIAIELQKLINEADIKLEME